MRKKWIISLAIIIGLVIIGSIVRYQLNPLNTPRIAFDLKKGDIFELTQDVCLCCSVPPQKEHRWMEPGGRSFNITIDELRQLPDQEKKENNSIIKIAEKGALIQFTRIGRVCKWNTGAHFIYYGKIISGEQASEVEVSLSRLLFDIDNKRTDQYLIKKENHN